MITAKRVSDYFMDSRKTEAEFAQTYNHPFLVLISDSGEVPEDEVDGEYFTTVGATISMDDLQAISEGRILDPEARVFPVVKRPGINPYTGMVTVGRADNCDIIVRSSEISKFHFYLVPSPIDPQQFSIGDGGSKNGTKRGEVNILPKKTEPITSGDSIFLGSSVVMRFFTPNHFQEMVKKSPRIPSLMPSNQR